MLKSQDRFNKALGLVGTQLFGRDECMEMCLKSKQTQDDKPKAKYWESRTLWIPLHMEQVSFSVYFVDLKRRSIIDNRRVDYSYLINPAHAIKGLQKGVKIRGNKICFLQQPEYKQFVFTEITDKIVLGSCMNENSEKNLLASTGINGILNLETTNDQGRQRRPDKSQSKVSEEIPEFRFPIEDSIEDLSQKVINWAHHLKTLIDAQKVTLIY